MKKLRFISTILAFIIAITSVSCTKQNTSDVTDESGVTESAETAPKEYLTNVFSEEEVDFPDGFELLEGAMDYSNDTLRYVGIKSVTKDGKDVRRFFLYETGAVESETKLEFDITSASFGFFNSDDLYLVRNITTQTSDGAFETRCEIVRYNTATSETGKVENAESLLPVMDENSELVISAAVDSDGYIYYTNGVSLCVLKPDFTKDFDYVSPSYITKLVSDGKGGVYMITSDSINKIDRENSAPGDVLNLPADTEAENCWFAPGYDVYYSTDEGLFGWSEGMDAGEMVVNWSNSCINAGDIISLTVLSKDRILITYDDWAATYRYNVTSMFTRSADIDISEVTVIEIAGGSFDYSLNAKVAKFNKTHKNIQVVAKDYNLDHNLRNGDQVLTNEILTGVYTPDLICGLSSAPLLKVAYRDKLFTNLYDFMETDDDIKRDDIVGIIKNTYELDGELGAIAPKFKVQTLVAQKSVVGDRNSWTVGDVMDMADTLADDELLLADRVLWVDYCSPYAAFIDMEKKTCSFNDPAFVRLMEFLAQPEKSVEKSPNRYEPYQTGKVKLYQKEYNFLEDIWSAFPIYKGEDFVNIGYPVSGENASGTVIDSYFTYAYMIPKNSPHPKEAWEFLKFLILDAPKPKYYVGDGIRALKSMNYEMGDKLKGYKFFYFYNGEGTWWNAEDEKTRRMPQLSEDRTKMDNDPGVYAEYSDEVFDGFMNLLETAGMPISDMIPDELNDIIEEEISVYTSGTRSAEDTAKIIQSRGVDLALGKILILTKYYI